MTLGLRRPSSVAALLGLLLPPLLGASPASRLTDIAQPIPFAQDWTNTGLITVNDDWSGVPGIIGYLGDGLTGATGTDPQTIVAFGSGTQDVIANLTSASSTAGGVGEFHLADPVVGFQGSGTAACPFVMLHVDATGYQDVQVAYNLRDIDGTADNAVQPVAVQYRIGTSGNFTNLATGFVPDATTGPSQAVLVTPVSVTLPADVDDQPMVQVRVMTCNAAGSDEWVGIDDINVTGTGLFPSGVGNANPNPVTVGNTTLLTVAVTPGNPPSPIQSVVVDLSSIEGSATQAFFDDGTNGDVTAGDNVFSFLALVPETVTAGPKSLPAEITDQLARVGTATIALTVQGLITAPTGVGAANPSTVPAGESTTLTVTVTPGTNPTSSGITVEADLTPIGGPAAQPFFDDGTNGDVTAGDNMFTFATTVPLATPPGAKTLTATIGDAEGRSSTAPIALTTTDPIPPVVVSQVYGGGGASGALFRNDFIEIFNRGPGTADLTGWSVQYASASGTTWEVTPLSGTLAAGRYFLVQQASGGASGANLPTPDATGTSDVSASAGKVVLVRTTAPESGSCPAGPGLMDLVGYGTADCFEGAGPAPSGSASLAPARLVSGCADNDNNSVDFSAEAPSPRNTTSAPVDCTVPPPTAPLVAINQIQGNGPVSPYVGQVVRARGVVTGRTSNSYYLQTPDGDPSDDGDPTTSEGVIVFTGSSPAVAPGQYLEVTGVVDEFIPSADLNSPPKTEIAVASTLIFSSGNPLPAPVAITAADTNPAGGIDQLEKHEAMRVSVATLTVTGPSQGSINEPNATSTNTGVFYGVITGQARPFREPGIEVPDPLPPGAPANIPRFDANPERLRVDSDLQTGAAALAVGAGAVVTSLVGPLDYSFRTYTVAPDPGAPPTVVSGPESAPLPAPGPGQFTVGSYNIQRFFDNVNDPNISEPVLTATAYNNRLNKASLYIRNILRSPDIIGVQEVENVSTLQTLASKLNNDTVLQGLPNPGYVAYLVEGNDVGGIDVGFLVKTSRVAVGSVTQVGKSATYVDPNTNQPALLNDRPPLVLVASIGGRPLTVVVNHLRSLSDIDSPTDGHRVRTKRRAQAEFLADLVQDRQLADPTERMVVLGDLNAFQFNDGYVDVVGTIKGQPTPPDQVVLASADLVDPDLVNLEDAAPAEQRYSFVFDGNAQTLDHALVTQNMAPLVAAFARGRGNADSADTLRNDPTRPERVADHDPLLVYFNLPEETQTTVVSSPNPSSYGQDVTFTATVTSGANPVTSGSVSFRTATQVLGSAPVNATGQAALVTAALPAGSHTVTATFGGSGTLAPSSDSLVQTVAAAATTTIVSGNPNPSGFGQPVTITATVSGASGPAAEGTVTFRDGATVISPPVPVNASGQASFSISSLGLGNHPVTAEYSGSANFGASSGNYVQNVQPGLRIGDAFVMEGDAPGTVAAVFDVSLSIASGQAVTVSYATQDGTATAGSDYLGRSGQLLFPAGTTTQTVAVVILSDTLNEADETFSVALSAAAGAVIVDSEGAGTIVNDDPLPSLSIGDATVAERRGPAVFTVSLSAPSGRSVQAAFMTSDGTATSPGDYVHAQGTVTFPAGTTTQTIAVTINADGIPEPAERFYLLLSNVSNASLADGLGIGTIRRSGELPGSPSVPGQDVEEAGVEASGGFER